MTRSVIVAIARVLVIALFAMMAGIQVLIALYVLPQDIIWGGSHSEHSLKLSAASLAAALFLLGFAAIIHRRATAPAPLSPAVHVASWFVTTYMLLNTVGNVLSSNPFERYVFGSVTAVLFVYCSIVSLSSQLPSGAESYELLGQCSVLPHALNIEETTFQAVASFYQIIAFSIRKRKIYYLFLQSNA